MPIIIRENNFNDFFETPFVIYENNFPFVSEFKDDIKRFLSIKNPLFKSEDDFKYYTAYKDGKLCGRITAHIHHASNQRYNIKKSYFGYFDVINDIDVAQALLAKAENFAKKHNCTSVIGNFNLTAMQKAGVVTEFYVNEQYMDQIINPLYLPELLEKCGYHKTFPMKTFMAKVNDYVPETMAEEKVQSILKNPDYTFDKLDKRNFSEILETMRICLNEGFHTNSFFVPLTPEEIEFQAKDLTLVIDTEISVICRYKGKPVGAVVCLPNLNPFLKKTKSRLGLSTIYHFIKHKLICTQASLIFYSVIKEYQSKGINTLMINKLFESLKKRNYEYVGGTWIADENIASLKIVEKFNAKPMHKLYLFEKTIS